MKPYTVSINSDRVHISKDSTPLETIMFSLYADGKSTTGREEAIGEAVVKAIYLNRGSVVVTDLSENKPY